MKPFDLEAAKRGEPVVNRDKGEARIVCFDAEEPYPIVAIHKNNRIQFQLAQTHMINGRVSERYSDGFDLFMKE
jgi:hypothetical protein